jgi:hypothetical protein
MSEYITHITAENLYHSEVRQYVNKHEKYNAELAPSVKALFNSCCALCNKKTENGQIANIRKLNKSLPMRLSDLESFSKDLTNKLYLCKDCDDLLLSDVDFLDQEIFTEQYMSCIWKAFFKEQISTSLMNKVLTNISNVSMNILSEYEGTEKEEAKEIFLTAFKLLKTFDPSYENIIDGCIAKTKFY